MKILIDIGHPAHVHYFKNFIKIMQKKGHVFFISARDKEVSHSLLNYYNIEYRSRGKGKVGHTGKLLYLIKADIQLYKLAHKFQPDLFMSFSSPYSAQVSALMKKPHIAFDDTEHAKIAAKFYRPFSEVILTPSAYFEKNFTKQIKFDGYMELSYLHPNRFQINNQFFKNENLKKNIIVRFVSWSANHDKGQSGLDLVTKRRIVTELSRSANVYISSESEIPNEFKEFFLDILPYNIHDVLSSADLFIGEGATMASECAVLGTPAIYVNSLEVGYLREQENKYGLVFNFRSSTGVIEKALELLENNNLKSIWQEKRKQMLSEKIDVTGFMVWFVENYPKSFEIMKKDPNYQYFFK